MLTKSTSAAATAALATLAVAGSTFAAAPLAQFSLVPGAGGPSLSYYDGTFSTPEGGYPTQFSFQAAGLPSDNLDATLTFTAMRSGVSSQSSGPGGVYDIQPLSGTFSFVYTGSTPLIVGSHSYATGTTLLAGSFADALLDALDYGSTGSLTDSRLGGGMLNLTSDISEIQFGYADEGFSIALNSLAYVTVSGADLSNFTANSAGNFASDIAIGGQVGGAVPEAGTWVLMTLGCGIAGARVRARRSRTVRS